ncbi:hypothetical protein RBA71_05275 [Brenneria goodwinii]|uniref:hypothetical protein n=1 Tax=Brenneria goodwinii TaxID=1109412 RepID=UPI0036E988C6
MSQEENKPKAPYMERSKIQLSTTYAPGSLFTFEGILIVCEAIPKNEYRSLQLNNYVEQQIYESIEERIRSWYGAAMRAATNPDPKMCVDSRLLDNDGAGLKNNLRKNVFDFVEPENIGYVPAVLSFVCSKCNLIRTFDNLSDFQKHQAKLNLCKCSENGGSPKWRQMDIVFVHPNGNYRQPEPWVWFYDNNTGSTYKTKNRCICGSYDTCLDNNSSQIGKRFYYCASCGMARDERWLQNDTEYLKAYPWGTNKQRPIEEIRMKPVSYRSNSVHYPMQDMIIDFGRSERLEVLQDNLKLLSAISEKFEIPHAKSTQEEIEASVKEKLGEKEWDEYTQHIELLNHLSKGSGTFKTIQDKVFDMKRSWEKQKIIENNIDAPQSLIDNLQNRSEIYSRKYDPFRLVVEHQALVDILESKERMENGLRYYTPLDDMDEYIGPEDSAHRSELNATHRGIMDSAGIETMGLLRKFKTIQYSFGYTRVDSKPTTNYINGKEVPVRLKLFDRVRIGDQQRNPVFTLSQNNEAIYVRLKESVVRSWLKEIGCDEDITDEPIGQQYLSHVVPMGQFLDSLPSEGLTAPKLSIAVYSLLHTYAHHVMYDIAEFSGLSTGSLGEYIFPSDLSFVVYRKGMTMDLGNLTSMLRNNTPAFLDYIDNRRNLECGSGSLCLERGGACPDCLLIPEVNCLTQNNLLSRTLLIGKGSPKKYGFTGNIKGYLDVASEI